MLTSASDWYWSSVALNLKWLVELLSQLTLACRLSGSKHSKHGKKVCRQSQHCHDRVSTAALVTSSHRLSDKWMDGQRLPNLKGPVSGISTYLVMQLRFMFFIILWTLLGCKHLMFDFWLFTNESFGSEFWGHGHHLTPWLPRGNLGKNKNSHSWYKLISHRCYTLLNQCFSQCIYLLMD